MKNRHTLGDLRQMQSLPLKAKIQMTRQRIRGWVDEFGEDGVYVSFSGGKDSTVLLDIVRKDYPDIEAVFVNTGLEYPSVRQFALSKENVKDITPQTLFRDVVINCGYPIISKHVSQVIKEVRKSRNFGTVRGMQLLGTYKKDNGQPSEFNCEKYLFMYHAPFLISDECCDMMKKSPLHLYDEQSGKKAIIGTMADESKQRTVNWKTYGCNAFEIEYPQSRPMSFWTENDVLTYIHENNLSIADAYGQVVVKNDGINGQINIYDYLGDYRDCQYETTGCKRTGCIFCGFGIRQDKQRFVRLSEQEPKLCDYVMRGGEFNKNGMWQPSKDGLGYWFVLEWLNTHGKLRIGIPNRKRYLFVYQAKKTRECLETEGQNYVR